MDREQRIRAGFDVARALGLPEGRDIVEAAGHQDEDTIAVDGELGKQLAACWRTWSEVRPHAVTDEQRVAAARAQYEAEVAEYRMG